jgi:phage baseplate assembly protein W
MSTEEFLGEGPEVRVEEPEAASPPASATRAADDLPPLGALAGKRDELPATYARIVRRLLSVDVEDAFEKVTAGLRRGTQKAHRAEYGDLVDELDEASELTLLAHQLAASAAVTVARYEADLEVLQSDMRAQAKAALNRERDEAGGGDKKAPKPKQVTDADVVSRMAGSYPAEFRRLETLLAEAKAAQKFIVALPEQWAARRREIEARVRTVRKG